MADASHDLPARTHHDPAPSMAPIALLSFSDPMLTATLNLWCVVVDMVQRSDSSRRRPNGQSS